MSSTDTNPWELLQHRIAILESQIAAIQSTLNALCIGIELADGYPGAHIKVTREPIEPTAPPNKVSK